MTTRQCVQGILSIEANGAAPVPGQDAPTLEADVHCVWLRKTTPADAIPRKPWPKRLARKVVDTILYRHMPGTGLLRNWKNLMVVTDGIPTCSYVAPGQVQSKFDPIEPVTALFTAGFNEAGTPEGNARARALLDAAGGRTLGDLHDEVRVQGGLGRQRGDIGPLGDGVHHPRAGRAAQKRQAPPDGQPVPVAAGVARLEPQRPAGLLGHETDDPPELFHVAHWERAAWALDAPMVVFLIAWGSAFAAGHIYLFVRGLVALILFVGLWRRGLKHYSAVGG